MTKLHNPLLLDKADVKAKKEDAGWTEPMSPLI